MKVLLINGSPKAKGCTYTALATMAETLHEAGIETEIFHIGAEPIGGCRGCGACRTLGRCVFDDVVNIAAEKAKEADAFVFGSPVHYAAMSGNLTCFLDRLFYSNNAAMRFKPAAICCTARRAGTTATLDQLVKYPMITQMPVISASYWPMVHGNTPEELVQDLEGMEIMRQLGRNMAWTLHCIAAGKAAGHDHPAVTARPIYNYIR